MQQTAPPPRFATLRLATGPQVHYPAGGGDPPRADRPAGAERLPGRIAARAMGALADPVPADFVREFQAGAAHVPLPERFVERLVAESRKLPARVWRDAADGLVAFDDTADLGRIAAPTLLVWGDHDGLLPPQEQQRLAAAIPGARSRVYPETGHSPHWERPERFAADLDAFIR